MTHRKAWEQQMIYLMMIDAEEDKHKSEFNLFCGR